MHRQSETRAGNQHKKRQLTNAGEQCCTSRKKQTPNQGAIHASHHHAHSMNKLGSAMESGTKCCAAKLLQEDGRCMALQQLGEANPCVQAWSFQQTSRSRDLGAGRSAGILHAPGPPLKALYAGLSGPTSPHEAGKRFLETQKARPCHPSSPMLLCPFVFVRLCCAAVPALAA